MALRRLFLPAALFLMAVIAAALVPEAGNRFGSPPAPQILEGIRIALVASAWLSGAWVLARLLDEVFAHVGRVAQKPRVPRLLSDLLRALLFGLALLGIVTTLFGASLTGFLATSSILIAVLGFALRNIIGDIFSGIALNIEHPYRLGDWIEVASGTVGQVVEINWRATRMITNDGVSVVVPNGLIAGGRLANFSQPERSHRTAVPVCLPPEVPVERAKRLLLAAVLCSDRILAEPRPDVLIEGIDDRGIKYLVRFWLPDHGQEIACRDAVLATVLRHLRQAGIETAPPRLRLARADPRQKQSDAQQGQARRLLGQIDLFAAFEGAELDRLAAVMHCRHLPEGTVVVRQGDPGTSLFLIEEGALAVRASLTASLGESLGEGRTLLLDRMGPGEVFGEMSLLTGQARSATVTALTDSIVHEIDREHIQPFLSRRPELAENLAKLMGVRQQMNRTLTEAETAALVLPKAGEQDMLARLRAFFRLSA